MNPSARWTIATCAAAAVLAATFAIPPQGPFAVATAQAQSVRHQAGPTPRNRQQAAQPSRRPAPSGRTAAEISAAHAVHRRRRCCGRHSRHAGCAVLGGLRSRLREGAAGAAGTVAHSLDRRRRRRVRRRFAQRLERRRQPAGLFRRHRRQHRRADGAVCLRRLEIRRGLEGRLYQNHRGGHFRSRLDRREFRRFLAAEGSDRQTDHAAIARRHRRRLPGRTAALRSHHRSRCRALRGLEHGRHRRACERQD